MVEIYDRLLQFTLFQGMSHADLMQVAGHTKFGFTKLPAGKKLVREGDPCTHLIFLTSGTLSAETQSNDHACRVVEQVSAPYMVQPEHLFGMTQRYTTTFRTLDSCNFITLDKQEVLLLLETQLVFRLNMLNLATTETQRLRNNLWRQAPQSLRERMTRFFFSRCLYPAGPKIFYLLMNQLAADLNDSRLDISKALNQMQEDGLLTLHRGRIEIPMLERLLM
ncbi:MAG: Crp/Fnr family transcriptional regulator [Prevotella sp.]|nr:Crp/Fnr family transcriptional regulator [Prevotella sp.]